MAQYISDSGELFGSFASPIHIQETITMTATTTNPTKTHSDYDSITLTDDGSGYCFVNMKFKNTGTANTSGTGDYLFLLPAGYKFNQNYHPPMTAANWGTQYEVVIPGSKATVGIAGYCSTFVVVPYDETRFKLHEHGLDYQGTYNNDRIAYASGVYGFTTCWFTASFRFKKSI